jgi:xanthine dehydrogenase small subunit
MSSKDSISFILDGQLKTICFNDHAELKPTTTVLNYLRSLSGHKGVKEGCAEGDCGACTVVVAEPGTKEGLKYTALDSCLLFLPMIHGKQLITVENLAIRKGNESELHPVQKTMVELNGSQCGYCTPGIVMAMFALYKNHDHPGREIVEDALTGNLCRCTGYQPIIDAAMKACTQNGNDHFTAGEQKLNTELSELNRSQASVKIVTSGQSYFRPARLSEALSLRKKYPDAIIVNGATDVALRQTKKREHLNTILDLSGIAALKFFRKTKDAFHIGAGLSIEELKSHCKKSLPALHEMLTYFASLQIRNIATIGGNVGSASPIGDTIPLLIAYGAKVLVTGSSGNRKIEMEDFIKGYRKADLQPDELIHSIIIPKPVTGTVLKSYKVSKRKDLDISTLSGGFMLQLDPDNLISNIILAYGGMAERPKRAWITEAFLKGKRWTRENVEAAMGNIPQDFTPLSDARSGKEFRLIAAGNLLLKFFLDSGK